MEDDGFTLVRNGRKRHKTASSASKRGRTFLDRSQDGKNGGLTEFLHLKSTINIGTIRIDSLEALAEQIEKCCGDLRREHYLGHLASAMNKCLSRDDDDDGDEKDEIFDEIVCFGLGNFCESITSLYQLALLVCMRDELKCARKILIYDPCFTEFELSALRSPDIDFHPLANNTECRHPVTRRTLFFMPHMYAVHYNNLIESNWHRLTASNVAIYCNSFQHLLSATEDIDQDFPHLARLKNGNQYQINEYSVRNEFIFNDIFNNLSLHTFTEKP